MSQWLFRMESLSELDGGLTGRLGATLHTTGPCAFGTETPGLRGRSDLKGVPSRSLMGPANELISMGPTSCLSAFRPVWKHLGGAELGVNRKEALPRRLCSG